MNAPSEWREATKGEPCPICEKPDWCSLTGPEKAIKAVVCMRVKSDNKRPNGGWLHRLRDDEWRRPLKRARRRVVVDTVSPAMDRRLHDFERFAATCYGVLSPAEREQLATDLGVSVDALAALQVGWSTEHRAYTFPMYDAAGAVRGVRLRGRNGRKWSVRGGREGLFVPQATGGDATVCLLVCEGPTDAAALFDLGFDAIGRPSCTGGVQFVCELVQSRRPNEVAIIADADTPGLLGANNLASVLAVYVHSVRVVTPPPGVKDARDWKRQGATPDEVLMRIAETEPRYLGVVGKAVAR